MKTAKKIFLKDTRIFNRDSVDMEAIKNSIILEEEKGSTGLVIWRKLFDLELQYEFTVGAGELEFRHYKTSTDRIFIGRGANLPHDCEEEIYLFRSDRENTHSLVPPFKPKTAADVRDYILRTSYIKGELFDRRTGTLQKFRPAPPRVSCDNLFWTRFPRKKVRGRAADFKDWLWGAIRDCYINHDNPNTDPLQGKREEILHNALLLFRVVNLNDREGWRPVHIDNLPDPTMGRPLSSLDTLNRYIQALER